MVPLGDLPVGLYRHRALLFKVLADSIELPCRLVRAIHNVAPGGVLKAAALVRVDGKEMMVDLMRSPGRTVPFAVSDLTKLLGRVYGLCEAYFMLLLLSLSYVCHVVCTMVCMLCVLPYEPNRRLQYLPPPYAQLPHPIHGRIRSIAAVPLQRWPMGAQEVVVHQHCIYLQQCLTS